MNTHHKSRLAWLSFFLLAGFIALCLILYALRQNLNLFYFPKQIAQGQAPRARKIRVGGLVVAGSIEHFDDLEIRFVLRDDADSLQVGYRGLLPDLFKENQGVVARGILQEDGSFKASEILAKHDENYMPPELAPLKKNVVRFEPL